MENKKELESTIIKKVMLDMANGKTERELIGSQKQSSKNHKVNRKLENDFLDS